MKKIKRKNVKIAKRIIGDNSPVFIIAETGTNHNGNIETALKMVEKAALLGADAVKFQTIDADASYIKGTLPYNIYNNIRFTKNDWKRIKNAADKNNISFFSAPADIPSVHMLKDVGMPVVKISSGSMTNIALVREMAELKVPVMISTGMSYLKEIKGVVSEFEKKGAKDIIILHCISLYPAESHQLNLNAIKVLGENFSYPIGYSDHTRSNIPSIAAISLGARVLEKHFTIDRKLGGPEQEFSYDLDELKTWIDDIRYTEKVFGSFKKMPHTGEMDVRKKFRRCLVANRDIKRGEIIAKDALGLKRPIGKPGLNTIYFEKVVGKRAKKHIKMNQPIYEESV